VLLSFAAGDTFPTNTPLYGGNTRNLAVIQVADTNDSISVFAESDGQPTALEHAPAPKQQPPLAQQCHQNDPVERLRYIAATTGRLSPDSAVQAREHSVSESD